MIESFRVYSEPYFTQNLGIFDVAKNCLWSSYLISFLRNVLIFYSFRFFYF